MASMAALRSLNSTFVRKGIVADSNEFSSALPAEVVPLIETLKTQCAAACAQNVREISNAIQLWKERSLYDTLQALDGLTRDPRGTVSTSAESANASRNDADHHERQIQAIENHEKAGREMNELLQRDRTETIQRVHHAIDAFSAQLAHVLHEPIKPELEEELEREHAIVDRLVQEKQKLDDSQRSLVSENQTLAARIESLENDPNGGGDAILCKKLRARVRQLSERQRELLNRVDEMEKEREKHRWAMQQMRNDLELQQRTFLMTKAMHEKETKQLVDLVQHRQTQFVQVMQEAKQVATPTLEIYDPLSGHTMQYLVTSPTKRPDSPRKTKLVSCAASPTRSGHARHQNQHPQTAASSDDYDRIGSNDNAMASSAGAASSSRSSSLPSPWGHILRDPSVQRSIRDPKQA